MSGSGSNNELATMKVTIGAVSRGPWMGLQRGVEPNSVPIARSCWTPGCDVCCGPTAFLFPIGPVRNLSCVVSQVLFAAIRRWESQWIPGPFSRSMFSRMALLGSCLSKPSFPVSQNTQWRSVPARIPGMKKASNKTESEGNWYKKKKYSQKSGMPLAWVYRVNNSFLLNKQKGSTVGRRHKNLCFGSSEFPRLGRKGPSCHMATDRTLW